jgi:hypothetical protein
MWCLLKHINMYRGCGVEILDCCVAVSLGTRFLGPECLAVPPADAADAADAAQAPRDKLVCVLNCCSMINAQLAKSSKAEGIGEDRGGTHPAFWGRQGQLPRMEPQPASQPANQPASQPANQPASLPMHVCLNIGLHHTCRACNFVSPIL